MVAQKVQEFLDSRRYLNWEAYRRASRALLACDREEVQAELINRLQSADVEERARVIEGLTLLYKSDATDTILCGLRDHSDLVRWVTCGCLHDYGDERAQPGLLDRLKHDSDSHVRGIAAGALGRVGTLEILPDLYAVGQTDHEADSNGHIPSHQSRDAITEILWRWVVRQIPEKPLRDFEEQTSQGRLKGQITAEGIPFDDQGRILHTARYAHLPISAFGNGRSTKLNLQTNIVAPFEVVVEYADPSCIIQRIFVFCQIPGDDEVNWSIHTILVPLAMNTTSQA